MTARKNKAGNGGSRQLTVGPAKAPVASVQPLHRTVDRVTRILEEVVYNPGIGFAELARALEAPKSSVHGFIRGLLAKGWLYENQRHFYLGPAVYGLTLASGQIRAGLVTHADLAALHGQTGIPVVLGVVAGDHLIYIAEAGIEGLAGFEARSNVRRNLLATASGKALLATWPAIERDAFLRRHRAGEPDLVEHFLSEYEQIVKSRIATNVRLSGARYAIAAAVRNQAGEAVAAVTLVGPTAQLRPRAAQLSKLLLKHVDSWSQRTAKVREAI